MDIGIDVGSTGIKIIFVKQETPDRIHWESVIWKSVVPTKPGQSMVVESLIDQGIDACGLRRGQIDRICVTGYGRKLIRGADQVVDEISANAAGIHALTHGRASTLINVGGQDVKIIRLAPDGTVEDFRMNDKCAAGTGRFFEIAARILDTPLEDFHPPDEVEAANINATCAVFAESEIVSLMANDIHKDQIIKGINQSVAKRIAALTGNGVLEEEVFLDGGPAMNRGLVESLEDALLCDIHVTQAPQFTVALGAVLAG